MNHRDLLCYISSGEHIILSIFEQVEAREHTLWTGTWAHGNIHFVDLEDLLLAAYLDMQELAQWILIWNHYSQFSNSKQPGNITDINLCRNLPYVSPPNQEFNKQLIAEMMHSYL